MSLKRLSIAAKDTHTEEHAVGYYNTGDRMQYWDKIGATGEVLGPNLWLRNVCHSWFRPILVAGPLLAWVVARLEGAVVVGGASALGAGVASIGIPNDSVIEYETVLMTDKFLLIVHLTQD